MYIKFSVHIKSILLHLFSSYLSDMNLYDLRLFEDGLLYEINLHQNCLTTLNYHYHHKTGN